MGIGRFDTLLLAGMALIAFLLMGPLLTIPLHIPLSYNEGWNAYLDQRAIHPQTGPLYPAADSLMFNNYPPLSFYLVGAFGQYVVGDMIVAGRIVAMASLLASAALLGLCVRLLGGSPRGSLAASSLLLLHSATVFRDYVAIDDPQWLGHGLMLGGLAVLLGDRRAGRSRPGRVVAAALLMAAGGFVKHNLVGLPLAVTIWLAVVQPRTAAVWLASAIGWVTAGLAATEALHGRTAFTDILAHHRVYRADGVISALKRLIPLSPMLLMAGLAWRVRPRDDPPMLFAALFLAISLVTGILQRLGQGVNYNAQFETLIALCLTMGLLVSRAFAAGLALRGRTIGPAALAGFAILPVLATMPSQMRRAWDDIDGRAARTRSWQPVIGRIAASPGPTGCELLALCFWAGKPFALDLFNLNQSILTGGPAERFDGLVGRHAFAMFEHGGDWFTGASDAAKLRRNPVLAALLRHGYAPVPIGPDGVVLLMPPAAGDIDPRAARAIGNGD